MGRNNAIVADSKILQQDVADSKILQQEEVPEEQHYVIKIINKADHIRHNYVRPVSGIGDAVMLRPSIIGNMIKCPNDEHVIYSTYPFSEIYKDIEGLRVIDTPGAGLDDKLSYIEDRLVDGDIFYNVYNSCAIYETDNQPYKVVHNRKGIAQAISSGRHIILSRQEIWCKIVGVEFNVNNYNVKFNDYELEKAEYYKGYGRYMFLHMTSADQWRSYTYTHSLIDYFAKRYNGYVFIMDQDFQYYGRCKNVVTFGKLPIRVMWAIISNATLMVGVDSAGVHLAGSVKVPTFGLFGSTDPKMRLLYDRVSWMKRFSRIRKCRQPCWYLPCKHLSCLRSVSPRNIYKSVKQTLGDCL